MKRAAAAALFLFRFQPRVTGHVGALHPASPCSSAWPRQPRRLFPGARPSMLAPCTPQALVPSSGRANPGAFFPARGLPCWRRPPRKPLFLRRATPTSAPFSQRVGFHVGALHPASPCSTVGLRQPRCLFPGARPFMLAPCIPQALVSSPDRVNPDAFFLARGLPCWRLASRKPLFLHRTAPTPAPFSRRAAFHVGALHPASPCSTVGPRQPRRLFPGARPFMLASCTPQALVPSSDRANTGAAL